MEDIKKTDIIEYFKEQVPNIKDQLDVVLNLHSKGLCVRCPFFKVEKVVGTDVKTTCLIARKKGDK